MDIYLCTIKPRRIVVEYIDIWPRYEEEGEGALIVAPTRGKARAIFAEYANEEFTYPMSIKKMTHSIPQSELTEGVLDGYFLTEDKQLLLDSELDNYLDSMAVQDDFVNMRN